MMVQYGSVISQGTVVTNGNVGLIEILGREAKNLPAFGLTGGFANKLMSTQLDFTSLFTQALMDWPQELDLSELQHAAPDFSRYTVSGLGNLSAQIEEKYIDVDTEVIFRDLHISIYSVVLAAAKFVLEIKMSSIRPETVRLIFERRLKTAASAPNLNWRSKDYDLVKSYFTQNLA